MTLVSHTYRFVFLKTFKTASTSVEGYLERFCLPEGTETGDMLRPAVISDAGIVAPRGKLHRQPGMPWRGHMAAAKVRDELGAAIWDSYTRIHTTRNVYERLISNFGANHRDAMQRDTAQADRIAAFRDWLLKGEKSLWDLEMYMIDGQPATDTAIRYEHLHADMAALSHRLNLPAYDSSKLPYWRNHEQRRKRLGDPADYYDSTCIDFVKTHFAWEIETFGYTLADMKLNA